MLHNFDHFDQRALSLFDLRYSKRFAGLRGEASGKEMVLKYIWGFETKDNGDLWSASDWGTCSRQKGFDLAEADAQRGLLYRQVETN